MKIIFTTFLLILLSTYNVRADTNEMQLQFDETRSAVIVEQRLCMPNQIFMSDEHRDRISSSELKRNLSNQKQAFVEGVQTTFNLNLEQAQSQFYYAVFLVNDINAVPLNIEKNGNETCFKKLAPVLIDKQRELERILPLTNKGVIHFTTLTNQYVKEVSKLLTSNKIPINNKLILQASTAIASYNTADGPTIYQTFDLDAYKALYRSEVATVFVAAHDDYIGAISSYLSRSGFNIVKDKNEAYWNLIVKIQTTQNGLIDIEIKLDSEHSVVSIKNNPQDLRIKDLQESGLINKAIEYHLSAMSLDQYLSFKTTDEP